MHRSTVHLKRRVMRCECRELSVFRVCPLSTHFFCLYITENHKEKHISLHCATLSKVFVFLEAGRGRCPELLPYRDQTDGGKIHEDPGVH